MMVVDIGIGWKDKLIQQNGPTTQVRYGAILDELSIGQW